MVLTWPFLSSLCILSLCPIDDRYKNGPNLCSSWGQGPGMSAGCLSPGAGKSKGMSPLPRNASCIASSPPSRELHSERGPQYRALRRHKLLQNLHASVCWLLAVESSTMQGLGTLFLGSGDLGLNLYHLNVRLYNVEQVFLWALVFPSGKWGSNSNMIN